ncbi:PsbP family [Quillaja saponaria]|uniref:PsbP family n=1 Tax=Quillaja saponaria TaxID=32244 RepID=A0AAD7QAK9_QUISA|nr:PsbP family [Quillaja saponaria]
MALQHSFRACNHGCFNRIYIAQCVGDRKDSLKEVSSRSGRSPADELAPMALTFRRRLLESSRNLKLDVIYPIKGYSRCIDINEGFEFVYPANWVGDQTLLYRAAEKKELERSLDPPPITPAKPQSRRGRNVSEPVIAFGPPGSSGELNVSVIVSLVPLNFSIEAFGGPKEVGEAISSNHHWNCTTPRSERNIDKINSERGFS